MSLTSCGAVNLSPYQQAIRADGAIGYWRMDAASGTTERDRLGANPATYGGTVSLNQAGPLADGDKAVACVSGGTGAGDTGGFATAACAAPGTTWTIELWLKRSGAPDSVRDVISLSPVELYVNTAGHTLRVYGGAGDIITGSVVVDDGVAWHHAVMVSSASGATVKLYVDGAQDGATFTASLNLTGIVVNFARTYTGGFTWGGSIDDVALYPVALSAAQINRHYQLRKARRLRPAA